MNWIEACVYTTTEATEAVCAALAETGINGVQIEDSADLKNFLSQDNGGLCRWDYVDEALLNAPDGEACVKFYVSDNAFGHESLLLAERAVMALLNIDTGLDLGRLRVETSAVDDEDWLNAWKKYYKPLEIGNKLVIRPEWEEYTGGRDIVITLNPGHVFGTGLHQSTQLCMEQLEDAIAGGERVLDLGCGSGILSITAMLLGAGSALAVDIDPNAADIAHENAAKNGITENYLALSGDAVADRALKAHICSRKYDVIIANIVADVIISLVPLAASCIEPGGVFITSGIIRERVLEVREALEHEFEIISETARDEWFCLTGQRGIKGAKIFR
ncbi:MAG: 50S ribosomal protein L11 methyltransferase [Defluviitaleaceae bacterium]|nr:50S ribosomal protein L11 methyltransferase [Defluviitaleaceae bacterium]